MPVCRGMYDCMRASSLTALLALCFFLGLSNFSLFRNTAITDLEKASEKNLLQRPQAVEMVVVYCLDYRRVNLKNVFLGSQLMRLTVL